MLREQFTEALKTAMRDKNALGLSTVRLVIAKLKEQDIEARGRGKMDGIDEPAIQQMLQGMIKQRRESIAQFEAGSRPELAAAESAEIDILQTYLPQRLSGEEIDALIEAAIAGAGASGVAAMGKVMSTLKPQLAGRADMAQVSARVKARLTG